MRFADVLMTAAMRGGGRDPDLAAWVAAVVANGGTVSAGRAAIAGQLISTEKASGAWSLTDDCWLLCAENATQALTSLKQRRLATVTAAPTFAADAGYTFNGTTNYIDTGFIPSTHAVAQTDSNARIAVYERANLSSTGYAAGARSTTNRRLTINPRGGSDNMLGEANGQTATFGGAVSDSRGLISTARNGAAATDQVAYRNGVALTRTIDSGALSTRAVNSIFIGAFNNTGTAASFRAAQIGFVAVGATLSGALELSQYNAVQAWATAIGANV
jgi:hypothetical protein